MRLVFRGLSKILQNVNARQSGATVFGYHIRDLERYGVVEFHAHGRAISIEEKPTKPKSNYAVTGLYFYPNDVIDIAKYLKPSKANSRSPTSMPCNATVKIRQRLMSARQSCAVALL